MSVHRICAWLSHAALELDRQVKLDPYGKDVQVERATEAKRRRGSIN